MTLLALSRRLHANCTDVGRIVRKYPSTLVWPLLVLGLVLGLGVWGVVRITQVEENSAKSRASSLALDTATWFTQQISTAIAPVLLMSAMVNYNPQYDAVRSLFEGLAPALLEQDPMHTIKQLEFVPNGVIADMYPRDDNDAAEGVDLFNTTDREGALKTVQDRALTLVGPLHFFEGGHGVIVRHPIFVSGVGQEEDFGMAQRLNPYCGAPCAYDAATRTKFWGFAAGLISLDRLSSANDSKLRVLESLGYRYEVRALGIGDDEMSLVAESPKPVSQPVEALIQLPNTRWVVRVSPEGDWRQDNFAGMVVAVVMVAVALALLLFAALVSRKRHQMLLEALLPQHVIKDLRGVDASLLGGPRILQAETTADLMLSLLNRLLEGYMPDLRDVVFIRQAIIRGADLYQPTDLKQHIRNANLDNEVARALMQQLGGNNSMAPSMYDGSTYPYDPEYPPARATNSLTTKSTATTSGSQQPHQDCSTLSGALALILTPLPAGGRDAAEGAPGLAMASGGDTTAEALLLPTRETEAGIVASPRHSAYSSVVRAMSFIRESAAAGGGGGRGGGGGGLAGAAPFLALAPSAPPPTVPLGASHCGFAVASSYRRASMDLVQEEDEQREPQCRRLQQPLPPQQQQQQPADLQQRPTPGSAQRRSSLTFRESLRLRSSCDDAAFPEDVERPSLPAAPAAPPALISDLTVGVAATAAAAGGDSDGRLTPTSVSTNTNTQEDNVLSTFAAVRRLPRRVASAISILGRPRSAQRRGSSLVIATNPITTAEGMLERRLEVATSAVTGLAGGGGGGGGGGGSAAGVVAVANQTRRASVTSVASVPEVPLVSELTGLGLGRGSATVMGIEASMGCTGGGGDGAAAAGSGRMMAALAGGGSSKRSQLQLGGPTRVVPFSRGVLQGSQPPVAVAPPPAPAPPLPVIEEVERLLATADSWQFNTWHLRDVTNGHALSALGFFLIHRAGLISHCNLKPAKLARLLRHIEAGYNDNPYHNATHAADVLQTLHVIIHGAQLHVHYLDPLGLLAAYFAAIVHDYGHPGLTNDFLIATSDPLAVRYNDRSPLENHHAAASFGLLLRPDLNALAPLSKPEMAAFRKQVIEMVLATDMKQHFSLLSQFNTAHRLAGFAHEANTDSAAPTKSCASSRPPGNTNSELAVVVSIDGAVGLENLAPKPLDETERLLSLQLAIKAADLGHLGEALDVHQRWLSSLEEEFFHQGDKERQLGIPISPLFDRAKQGVSKSQVGFYDFVALPLVHALCSAFPGMQPLMSCFLGNYNHWRSVDGQTPVTVPARGKPAAAAAPPPVSLPPQPAASAGMSVTMAPGAGPSGA